jgi:hypothetical protein
MPSRRGFLAGLLGLPVLARVAKAAPTPPPYGLDHWEPGADYPSPDFIRRRNQWREWAAKQNKSMLQEFHTKGCIYPGPGPLERLASGTKVVGRDPWPFEYLYD